MSQDRIVRRNVRSRQPISMRAILQAVAVVLVVFGIGAGLWALNEEPDGEPLRPVVGIDRGFAPEVSCDTRTLPEDDDPEGPPQAIGRMRSGLANECPDLFDGRLVEYVGEVIGDVLERDDGAWVLMNDDAYALETGPLSAGHGRFSGTNSGLSVWLPQDAIALVDRPGDNHWRGTVLRVSGTFLRADPDDGGGLTIRARTAERVAEAVPIDAPVNRPKAIVAGLLAVAALASVVASRVRRETT